MYPEDFTLSEALAKFVKPIATIAVLTFFWSWESVAPFFHYRRSRWKHAGRNLAIAFFNTIVLGLLFGTVTVIVSNWSQQHSWGVLYWLNIPSPWRVICAILLLDFWLYVWHRLNHSIPFLWRFHRMHHSDSAMDVTSATRFHTGELIASAVIRLVVIVVLGISISELLLSETLVVIVTMFHHANISLGKLDNLLRWVIVTPDMHKIHHSRYQPETDSNYSIFLSLWDRMGRTFKMRSNCHEVELGLNEFNDEKWQSLWGMLKTPLPSIHRLKENSPQE